MLGVLHLRGEVAVVGRRSGQRLWDLAERWYPETDVVPLREAEQRLGEREFRALGVRLEMGGWYAHPHVTDAPVGDRLVGRAEPRFDPRTRTLEVLGAWGDTSRLDEALASLAALLGAAR